MREWQATKARDALAEIIESAASGNPQLIRQSNGKAVVVVSKEYYDAHNPSLRDYLLTAGYAPDRDEFDDALQEIRESGQALFGPRPVNLNE